MRKLLLYTTEGCHLCEQAQSITEPLLNEFDLQLVAVEISEEDALVERYGLRIPVLRKQGWLHELDWPFDSKQIREYLGR